MKYIIKLHTDDIRSYDHSKVNGENKMQSFFNEKNQLNYLKPHYNQQTANKNLTTELLRGNL